MLKKDLGESLIDSKIIFLNIEFEDESRIFWSICSIQ